MNKSKTLISVEYLSWLYVSFFLEMLSKHSFPTTLNMLCNQSYHMVLLVEFESVDLISFITILKKRQEIWRPPSHLADSS